MIPVARIPGSLRALLSNLIDYAGLYPPAALPLPEVVARYERYRQSTDAWILNRLVLPSARLNEANVRDGWRIALLTESEPGPLPPQVETLETRQPQCFSLPTYVETGISGTISELPRGAFAKLRTGGLTPDAIPSTAHVADFLTRAAAGRVPFKATAGLHHPLRSMRPLTYAADAPCATMHGFLNVFTAAALAWDAGTRAGARTTVAAPAWEAADAATRARAAAQECEAADAATLVALLDETDARAFQFGDDALSWRGHMLPTQQLLTARREFAHSFGSCSFEEPVADLRELGLLP